jgi:hypothetical protein
MEVYAEIYLILNFEVLYLKFYNFRKMGLDQDLDLEKSLDRDPGPNIDVQHQ